MPPITLPHVPSATWLQPILSAAGGPRRGVRAGLFSLALALCGPLLAQGQAPVVTGVSPARNLPNAARASQVVVTFDQALRPDPATAGAVKVFSQQRGGQMSGTQGGTATVSGHTLTFAPTTAFRPGETVLATVTTAA